jgi:pimeloyl-ACP methyl ester carboxylesterase
MSAFFFGSVERQLFGFHHQPVGMPVGAVVICSPWGSEYQYAHRALRVSAVRLAERGLHVLRFDYSGVGDSWGDTTVGDMSAWTKDVGEAIEELRARSGCAQVDLVGLRIGAVLAASAASARADVRRVAMWDPVVDGREWFDQTRATAELRGDHEGGAPVEFGSRMVSPALVDQFRSLGPESYPADCAEQVLLLQTIEGESSVQGALRHVRNLEARILHDVSPWLEHPSIWSGLVPTRAVGALCDWLGAT